ncbi:MAG TPA: hypothetical protein VEX69_07625 [Candidatus Limnocylindria bacterium]|nr:hypothetical protein [Candidatus Limnocylindria bacterium]
MAVPKRAPTGEAIAQAEAREPEVDFTLDEVVARDCLGRIREALEGFEAHDLRAAAKVMLPELKTQPPVPVHSLGVEELRTFLLRAADEMNLRSRVRVAEELSHLGFARLGKVAS